MAHAILIHHDELRASPLFANFQSPVMSPLVETDELESRLEAVIGTLIFERLDVESTCSSTSGWPSTRPATPGRWASSL